jgi:hypothetical protein
MISNKPIFCGGKLAIFIALGFVAFMSLKQASAVQLDCEKMADSLNTGDQYEFKIEIQTKMIRLEKGDDFCTEPTKDWFKRQLILPQPARDNKPVARKTVSQGTQDNVPLPSEARPLRQLPDLGLETDYGAAPLPIQREYVKPKKKDDEAAVQEEAIQEGLEQALPEGQQPPIQNGVELKTRDHVSSDQQEEAKDAEEPVFGVVAPPPPLKDGALAKRCDRDLIGFWSPGQHVIEGRKFWLSGVFTIDLNSDGRVDDVGFKIKSEGKVGNILNYFPSTEGRLSGKTIPSLKLEDDRDIHRLCPGNITFERPGVAPNSKKKRDVNKVRSLGVAKAKEGEEVVPEEEPEEVKPPKKKIKSIVFVVGGVAMILMLAGGIGLALAIRNMASSKVEEYEEEDEDEDD